jgi:hypothetical protein
VAQVLFLFYRKATSRAVQEGELAGAAMLLLAGLVLAALACISVLQLCGVDIIPGADLPDNQPQEYDYDYDYDSTAAAALQDDTSPLTTGTV